MCICLYDSIYIYIYIYNVYITINIYICIVCTYSEDVYIKIICRDLSSSILRLHITSNAPRVGGKVAAGRRSSGSVVRHGG